MGKINVLSFEIANLIAAGEVVERPASVLKELIENSIDSGATQIVAEIKKGGVALIRVTDNGSGISKDDLPVALKRHATSKIKEREDLNSILTLGFRGEALAAISSVSVMTIISKVKSAESGTMLVAEAGTVVDISEVGAGDGTTVVVENLFYNVPARRKFLKKDSTEAMNVTALVEKVALSRPDISIQLLADGEEKFKTPGNGNLKDTVFAVFGKEFAEKMIPADGVANGIKVHGFIGRSDNAKRNRNYQNVFINGRYVKSLTAMAAIEKAYTSYIAPECFPVCVLFVEMSPAIVDVNVHPAKLEVKFSDERIVFESIYYTVKTALENYEYRPELNLGSKRTPEKNVIGAYASIGQDLKGEQISIKPQQNTKIPTEAYDNQNIKDLNFNKPIAFSSGVGSTKPQKSMFDSHKSSMTPKNSVELLERYRNIKPDEKIENKAPKIESTVHHRIPDTDLSNLNYKIIGELFDCYIIVEHDDSVMLIDKHAAHERVIFEDLKRNKDSDGRVASQSLILPISAVLSPDEISVAAEYRDEICNVGFEYSINGKVADIIAIPDAISASDAEALFMKMLDEISEGKGNPQITESIRREKALYQIACKAAIKGGRIYDKSIIEWLVKKIMSIPDITVCPHGRPIAYKLTKKELDKQFDRIK